MSLATGKAVDVYKNVNQFMTVALHEICQSTYALIMR